ncbi:hypothetical protein CLAFUW4_09545 [Fulvia fulva]|uniref:Uncharacterized protein n=1 Tax=Passalora fulva TaxID=5499 RepID=A0A9Q8PGS9_PASFU|nr:uncharacterized protein CLAFUR5_09640 [Fulvia fulva]KAK4613884.1 hypothetical protein CLAFUR4_09551 [Fulvia fulva]KAK4614921.1 hypothetical protein CLAFUR0_09542 [Fulvia fulva]UJO22198.1 hypothetical protein CLAFUR5_09640 [Fulvia fulva]WPV20467.1 hypothetical protein CLAFUW4_09545 [Fulvia fulva]WPV35426.1 hypothetical protein CLAFUW7_09546 [Fulvia fulva]
METTAQVMAQSEAPVAAAFITLPTELHDMVCSFIRDTKTIKNVRDTCKALREKTDETYHKRKFNTLEINLTVADLRYVVKVSKHRRYSRLVQKIVIRPAFLNRLDCQKGETGVLLATALPNLKSLLSIEVLPYETGGNAQLRARANGRVPAVGDLGFDPLRMVRHDPALVHDPISHAFFIVRAALRYSKSVVHFKAGTAPLSTGERNSVDHAVIRVLNAAINNSLARLESFHLVAGAQGNSLNIELSLADLLRPMQQLKCLRLEFWGFHLEWLSKTFEDVTLPRLKAVHIQAARKVKATALKGFVQRHESLESLELSVITFDDDELDSVFPGIFEGLRLHKLKLSQLTSAHHGLLLLGTTCDIICGTCNKDLHAAWEFKTGPHCVHNSIDVTGSELAVSRELARRLEVTDLLPWPQRPPPPVLPATPPTTAEVQQSGSDDVVMEDKAAPSNDAPTTPVITDSSVVITDLARLIPSGYISDTEQDTPTRTTHGRMAPSRRPRIRSQLGSSRRPASTGIINLTGDSDEDDGPYDGYEDYDDRAGIVVVPEQSVQSSGRKYIPKFPRTRDRAKVTSFEDFKKIMDNENEDEDMVDVSETLGRLERKRAESTDLMRLQSKMRKLDGGKGQRQ